MGVFDGVELTTLVLHGPRLTLRPWQPGDADSVHAAMQGGQMHHFLPLLPDPYTREDAERFVGEIGDEGRADGSGVGCALVETASGRVVGSAALRLPAPRDVGAEIGYAVYPTAQGNGYAAEATRVLTDFAFAHDVARVDLVCAATNIPSARTAMKAGFRFEGIHRTDVRVRTGPVDGAVFSRLPSDPGDPIPPVSPGFPQGGLSDGTVTLRPLLPEDADGLFEQEDDEVTRSWSFSASGPSREDWARLATIARLMWLVGTDLRSAIVDTDTGRFAGMVNIRLIGPPQVGGIGYAVHPAFRGRGYTTRALTLLRDWAFDTGGFARLELGAKTGNVASQRAAINAGFHADGVREARMRNPDGTFGDEVRFAAVNPAYRVG
jgi:RimJ/RimL family protein N-acetyltransferase